MLIAQANYLFPEGNWVVHKEILGDNLFDF